MGQVESAERAPLNEREVAFIPYYVKIDDDVKPSEVSISGSGVEVQGALCDGTAYVPEFGMGIFVTQDFKKGDVVLSTKHKFSKGANDAMFDMRPIFDAKTATEMEQAFTNACEKYYDHAKAEKLVNVVLCSSSEGKVHGLYVIRDIAAGEEILRAYGFSTWIKEIAELNILTLRTLPGFLNYVLQMKAQYAGDPFFWYFVSVVRWIPSILTACYGKNFPNLNESRLAPSADFDSYWEKHPRNDLDKKVQFAIAHSPIPLLLPGDMRLELDKPKSLYLDSLTRQGNIHNVM